MEEIRHAYFQAARQYHPDLNTMPGDTEYFISAKEAFDILSDQQKRKQYDAKLPPMEESDLPIGLEVIYSRNHVVQLDEPQLVYALIKLTNQGNSEKNIIDIPLNLCLVIDRSSSMDGRKLDYAKASAIKMIKRLKPNDSFSLVAFSDKAEIINDSRSSENIARIESLIFALQPSGGTEIFNGLNAGYAEIVRSYDPNAINHIILLTDGRTYGDEDQCLDLASKAARQGIGISGLGIGSDWNDIFMDNLTSKTGGSSFFVSNPEEILPKLMKRFDQLCHVRVQNVTLDFSNPKHSRLNYAFRIMPEPGYLQKENPITLGPFFGSSDQTILMEFMVNVPTNSSIVELLDGSFNIFHSTNNQSPSKIKIKFDIPVHKSVNDLEPPPKEIVDALSELTFYRMQEEARIEAASGSYEKAIGHLEKLATHALQKGNPKLCRLIQAEVESIRSTHVLTPEGEKNIKYGTRALFTPSSGEQQS